MNLFNRDIEWQTGDINGCVGFGRWRFPGGLLSLVAVLGAFLTLLTVLSWVEEENGWSVSCATQAVFITTVDVESILSFPWPLCGSQRALIKIQVIVWVVVVKPIGRKAADGYNGRSLPRGFSSCCLAMGQPRHLQPAVD